MLPEVVEPTAGLMMVSMVRVGATGSLSVTGPDSEPEPLAGSLMLSAV